LPQTDVVIVVGANDVVNPAARHDPSSPIHGMPVIDADRARSAIVIKRSMSPGFAGIENELTARTTHAHGVRRREVGARRSSQGSVGRDGPLIGGRV
jgi:NAD(P) transhydrogenase subunit beta